MNTSKTLPAEYRADHRSVEIDLFSLTLLIAGRTTSARRHRPPRAYRPERMRSASILVFSQHPPSLRPSTDHGLFRHSRCERCGPKSRLVLGEDAKSAPADTSLYSVHASGRGPALCWHSWARGLEGAALPAPAPGDHRADMTCMALSASARCLSRVPLFDCLRSRTPAPSC